MIAGCSLLVSVSGLTGGSTSDPVTNAAPTDEAAGDASTDAEPPKGDAAAANALDAADAEKAADDSAAQDAADASDAGDAAHDAVADAGCFGHAGANVTMGAASSRGPVVGTTSGVSFDDGCPNGTALVGVTVLLAPGSLAPSGVQGVCASPVIGPSCGIVAGATSPLPAHGGGGGGVVALSCPSDRFVVGVRAATSNGAVTSAGIDCTPFVAQPGPGGVTYASGGVTQVGAPGVGTPFDCPTGMLATRLFGATTGSLSGLGIACSAPTSP